MSNVYQRFNGLHVKLIQSDNYALYGEVTEVGDDYLVIKYFDTKRNVERNAVIRFSAILKILEW